jgi:hypothetical protein
MREQRERDVMQTQQQHRDVEYAGILERLAGLFERWKVGCNLCQVNGRIVGRKGWRIYGCMSEGDGEQIDKACNWLRTIRWEAAWTACPWWCWAPQAICHSWEAVHDHRRSRYRKSGQQKCKCRGCLMEAVAIIMFHGGEEVMTWIFDEIEKRGET